MARCTLFLILFLLTGCVAVNQGQKKKTLGDLSDYEMPYEAKQVIASRWQQITESEVQSGQTDQYLQAFLIKKNQRSYASFSLHSPDLHREKIEQGQSLIISWALSKDTSSRDEVIGYLDLDLLFAKQKREKLTVPIKERSGKKELFFSQEVIEYKGMPLAYQILLKDLDNQVLMAAPHRLWAELLEFSDD